MTVTTGRWNLLGRHPMKLKHGYMREDGSFFWGYNKGREEWCNPDQWARRTAKKNRRSVWLAQRRRHWLGKYKESRSCHVCFQRMGYWPDYHSSQLAFHHTYDWEKSFTIGDKIKGPLKELVSEVSKCDVLCHNCHALEHQLPPAPTVNAIQQGL